MVYLVFLGGFRDKTGQDLMVALQKLAGGDSVNVVVCWWLCSKVKVSRGIKPFPCNGLEPALLHQRL